jgi:hypothetical protein
MCKNYYCDTYIHMLKESIILVIMIMMMNIMRKTKSS